MVILFCGKRGMGLLYLMGNRRSGVRFFAHLRLQDPRRRTDFILATSSGWVVLIGDEDTFHCCPPAKGPWPEVRPFANCRAKTKFTEKRKKEPQTSVHQRLRFFICMLSHRHFHFVTSVHPIMFLWWLKRNLSLRKKWNDLTNLVKVNQKRSNKTSQLIESLSDL